MKRTVWDELEDSFQGLKKDYPKGFTSREFAESTGVCLRLAREKLSKLHAAGRLKCLGSRPSTRMDGKPNFIPVYALCKTKP